MKYIPLLAATISALALSGCVQPPEPRMAFPESEYQALPKKGTATVKGQAFLKTRGGDVKTAAGNLVILNPVTSYSSEWYQKAYLSNKKLSAYDPRLESYIIKKTADAGGNFIFKNVPAGEYFISSLVTWEAPTGYQGNLLPQGGYVAKKIKVSEGEEVEVIVTR